MSIFKSTYANLATNNLVRSYFRDQRAIGEMPTPLADAVASAVRSMSKLYPLITVHKMNGKGRVYVVFADVHHGWSRCGSGLRYEDVKADAKVVTEIEGFQLTVPVILDNCYIEGSADHIEMFVNMVAGPMASALDNAILYGQDDGNMLKGIIPELSAEHIVKLDEAYKGQTLYDALFEVAALCELPKYEKNTIFGAVANRKTVSALLREIGSKETQLPEYLPQLLAKLAISEEMADGDILFGHMKTYRLYERGNYHADASSLGKSFLDEKTFLKAKAVFDSSFAEPECFALTNIYGMQPATSSPISDEI